MTIDNDHKRLMHLYAAIIALIVSYLLTACSSTHKTKSSHQSKQDSTASNSIVKKGISTSNSSGLHEKDSAYQNEITLEFEEEQEPAKVNDYEEAEVTDTGNTNGWNSSAQKKSYELFINEDAISSSKPIKSVTLKKAGQVKIIDVSHLQKKDSGQLEQKNDVAVHKEEKVKEKEVIRKGANPFIWIGLGAFLIAAAGISWRLGWFTKRKKDPFNSLNI